MLKLYELLFMFMMYNVCGSRLRFELKLPKKLICNVVNYVRHEDESFNYHVMKVLVNSRYIRNYVVQ
jgi:hypothetical protein